VTLTAKPKAGSSIASWGPRGLCQEGNSLNDYLGRTCTFSMDRDRQVYIYFNPAPTLQLYFNGTGSGTVTSSPPGLSCSASCKATFPSGAKVTLTAKPKAGSSIASWGPRGLCQEQGNSLNDYLGRTCTFSMDRDRQVYIYFNPAPTLSLYISGSGSVTSSPSGLSCNQSCKASFPTGTRVRLTARPKRGSSIDSWSPNVCTEQGNTLTTYRGTTCAFAMDRDRSLSVSFVQAPKLDPTVPPPDPPAPGPKTGVTVSVSGNGTVVGDRLACGVRGFRCYTQVASRTRIVLRAVPAPGSTFVRWSGACSGSAEECPLTVGAASDVSARFAPKDKQARIDVALDRPRLRVRWTESVAKGTLILRGSVAGQARMRIEVRRPLGRPLLTLERAAAGAFSYAENLPRSAPGGTNLSPGGFVIALTGTSGGQALPLQLRTVVLAAPPEGIVGEAFVSRKQHGRPIAYVPAAAREVWATFVFEAPPRAGRPIVIRWYRPNGKLLGEVRKPANRARVSSFLRGRTRLPTGAWRAELRVGQAIVKQLRVQVGCARC
jgi:hypothetical protein